MNIRGLIVAVVILAALTGALYWSNSHKLAETDKVPADLPPKILALKQDDIDGLAIEKKDAAEIVMKKEGNGWRITAPQAFAADQSAVSGIISTMAALDSQRLVEDKAADLNQYGLSQPSLAIRLSEKNNKTRQLLIGDATPTGNGVYAKLDGDPRVFTIASFNKSSVDKGLSDLRDKRLITAIADKISRIDLVTKHETLEFGRDKDQWQILKPKPMRGDGSRVDDLVRGITDARMDLTAANDPKKNVAAFASASPVASVKVTTESGIQELQVRKLKDDYYAKSTIVDGVYKVSSSLGQQLDKKLEDFRNKKLFDFGSADPNKIEIRNGTKTYFFTHSGDDWWSAEGKKLDTEGIEQLVAKLRDLQASEFPDSGFTNPVFEITLTSNDDKRTEKVLVSRAPGGKNYIAERQNEPTLYLLDESAVADLEKLAADVKPSVTPKK
jgi:Domain of unknown function (DUF4340)